VGLEWGGSKLVLVELAGGGVKRQRSTCDKCSIYIYRVGKKERNRDGM
jgi:hypothetical protein